MNATLLLVAAMVGQLDGGPSLGPAAPLQPPPQFNPASPFPQQQVIGDEPTPATNLNEPAPQPAVTPGRFPPHSPPRFSNDQPAQDFRSQPSAFVPRGEIAPTSGIGDPRNLVPLPNSPSHGTPGHGAPGLGTPTINHAPGASHPAERPAGGVPSTVAARALEESLKTPAQGAIAGHPISLLDAIARASEPSRRLAVVKHYWFVTYLLGEYHGALDDSLRLQQIGTHARAQDRAALESAVSAAEARLREAELNVVVSQYELAELSATPITDAPPIPSDRPLVIEYNTKFDTLFAGRVPPVALRRIDRTLPLRHGVLNSRAASLNAAIHLLTADIEGYRGGQTAVASVIAAQDAVRENRTAFLMAVRQYNFDIAEYALSIASPGLAPDKLIGMLIQGARSQQRSVLVQPSGNVQPVSAIGPTGPTPADAVAPATHFEKLPAGGRPIQPELAEPAPFPR